MEIATNIILKEMASLIPEHSILIVGLSGGPDSLTLLHSLHKIKQLKKLTIMPVHVNHMLRGDKSDSEEKHISSICETFGLKMLAYRVDCKKFADERKIGLEEAGRELRYMIFDDVAARVFNTTLEDVKEEDKQEAGDIVRDSIYILTGHNMDDNAETVLFRLLRGTGPQGLSGISQFRVSAGGFTIMRPLLNISRKLINDYIKENSLTPNIDESNNDNEFMRNKIRNELIPELESNYNPKFKEAINRFANMAAFDDDFLQETSKQIFVENFGEDYENSSRIEFQRNLLVDMPLSIMTRLVILMFKTVGLEMDISFDNVMNTVDLVLGENPSGSIDLPHGYIARREYENCFIEMAEARHKSELRLESDSEPAPLIRVFPQVIPASDYNPASDRDFAAFDYEKFVAEHPESLARIVVRTRMEGDYIPIKGGNKKLQDFLVDSKLPKRRRDLLQFVSIGSEILWIPPQEPIFTGLDNKGKYSEKYKINKSTKTVLLLEKLT